MSEHSLVASAVATLLLCNNRILLGRRIRQNRFVGWQCPGGFILPGETLQQAAKRHCLDKAGINVEGLCDGPYTNNVFADSSPPQHTVTLYQVAHSYSVCNSQRFKDAETAWQWFDFDEIPQPCFLPLKNLLQSYDLASLQSINSMYYQAN